MSIRLTYLAGFIAVCIFLAVGVYLQMADGFIPCHLCILQRVCFGLLGAFFLLGIVLHRHSWGRAIVNLFLAITSVLGIILSGRQIWLQQFHANDGSECGVSLQYMLQVLPLNEVMQKVFAGSGECSQRGWEFLYLNMAEWALICFTGFLLLTVYLVLKKPLKRL